MNMFCLPKLVKEILTNTILDTIRTSQCSTNTATIHTSQNSTKQIIKHDVNYRSHYNSEAKEPVPCSEYVDFPSNIIIQ